LSRFLAIARLAGHNRRMSSFPCPQCQQRISIVANLAGQAVGCPRCGQRIEMPYSGEPESPPVVQPPPPPQVQPQWQVAYQSPQHHAAPAAVSHYSGKKQWRDRLRIAAAVVTAMWLGGMWLVFNFSMQNSSDGTTDFVNSDAYKAGQFLGALFAGICFPSVPYAIAMIAIGVFYFACRDN
jgi:hypothetical protein